ncbi:MAG: transposase [Lentimicrobium sp.]|nr:transposase [Lentimicrobium sp.]
MTHNYKIYPGDGAYFVTFTIVKWIKVLKDDSYKHILLDTIRFYQETKGLIVYGYCIMPDHVHMIIQGSYKFSVSEILRDLKKFTSRAIVRKLEEDKPEGYQQILHQFFEARKPLKRIKNYKVWQDKNMAMMTYSNAFTMQKLNYIHNNPVKAGLCQNSWDYEFSSAVNYSGKEGLLKVELLSLTMNPGR